MESVPSLVPAAVVAAYVRDEETGGFRVARVHEIERGLRPRSMVADVPREVAESFLKARAVPSASRRWWSNRSPRSSSCWTRRGTVLIAPARWDPDGSARW